MWFIAGRQVVVLTIWYASFRNESFFSSSDCLRGGFGLVFDGPLFDPSAIRLRKSCVWSMNAILVCCRSNPAS